MQLVQGGDPRAFEVVYDRHAGPAFSLAYRMAGERGAAEEMTQEAFISVWRSRQRYDPTRGSVRSWVLGVVHNRAIDALRRSQRHASRRADADHLEELPDRQESTPAQVERQEDARAVRDALDDLPGEQTKVIELAYYGGFTANEIAAMLETPLGTVKSRMRLGLDKLRRTLVGVTG